MPRAPLGEVARVRVRGLPAVGEGRDLDGALGQGVVPARALLDAPDVGAVEGGAGLAEDLTTRSHTQV